jgi:hypothetical protein
LAIQSNWQHLVRKTQDEDKRPSMAIEINKQCKPGTDLIHLKDTTHCQNMYDNIKMDSIITVIECS